VEEVDSEAGDLTARFDGRIKSYGFGELDMLVPAYAVTIHFEAEHDGSFWESDLNG
jgi:exodeoxyribonuclease V alpha subunit